MEKRTKEKRLIRKFLRERGLSQTYRRFKSSSPLVRRRVSVLSSDYSYPGGARRRTLLLTKRRGKTVIIDQHDYKVVGHSNKKIPQVLKLLSQTERIEKTQNSIKTFDQNRNKFINRSWEITYNLSQPKLKIKNEYSDYQFNKKAKILNKTVMTNKPKRKRHGFAVIRAKYYSNDTDYKIITARSSLRSLSTAKEREKAIEEAIHFGSAVAGFSPSKVEVLSVWYEYSYKKRRPDIIIV
jgi:hypothetical protein